MKNFLFIFLVFSPLLLQASDIMKDFDSLGGNDILIHRAKLLQPDKEVKVVQDRIVDLNQRSEIALGYGNVFGGNSYLNTQMLLFSYFFHFNPRWSLGISYFDAYNNLSKEGYFLVRVDELVPDMDQPDSGYELMGNFAPIYGKINMFDLGVVHFDTYLVGSYGRINLKSGNTNLFSVGGGFGFWASRHLSVRLELRQRFYKAQRFTGPIDMKTTMASFTFGYLL